ncbi:MAG: hypothetical protein RIT27_576 [Pseudomonadota bacterium]|jgi:chemosensory pili system protein ChpA (sensor histidine kinase/response regulator)
MPLPLIALPSQPPRDEVDEEILEIFVEEVAEVLEDIKSNLVAWKQNPSDRDALTNLRRAFHTLKGSGRLVGALNIGELGWRFESLLNRLLDGTMQRNNNILKLLDKIEDHIPQMVDDFRAGIEKLPFETHLLISQADHLTQTKGAELGEFEGEQSFDQQEVLSTHQQPDAVKKTEEKIEEHIEEKAAPPVEEVPPPLPKTPDTERPTGVQPDVLRKIFLTEATQHLKTLKAFLIQARQSATVSPTDALMRALHTLNGSSRSVGLPEVAALAAPMEQYINLCLENHLPLKKEVLALLIESGKLLEQTLQHGKISDQDKHQLLLNNWQKLLHSFAPHDEKKVMPVSSAVETPKSSPTITQSPTYPKTPQPKIVKSEMPTETADEFMEIFLDEAEEILETCQSLLGRWQSSPNSMPLLKELQRELHTLKGGARMVGISAMGDLSHQLESVLTKIVDGNAQSNPVLQGIVQESVDELATMLESVKNGGTPNAAAHLINKIAGALDKSNAVEHLPEKTESVVEETKPVKAEKPDKSEENQSSETSSSDPDERVRVSAILIDKLTNLAGEMAISRAHMEQQQGAVKNNIIEMEQTVMRLRDQLRRLEIETEVQIISNYTKTSDFIHYNKTEDDFDLLEMDRFSTLQQLSRSLMETVNDLQNIQDNLRNLTRQSDSLLVQQNRIGAELQDGIMRTRMVPFSQISPRLHRIARLTSRELHKKINFLINDDTIEFERTVLNRIVAPLEHMLRNAIGHGIEESEVRVKAGKPDMATIRIDLAQEGAELVLRLSDDGGGLNFDAIREKAEARGLLKSGQTVSEQELSRFILEPAFSTAKAITQVSGRGVGMDIANSEIRALGGALNIHSSRGQGTTFEIRLPLSLTISQALLVHVGEETMAIPLHNVDAVMRLPRQEVLLENNEERFHAYMQHDYRIAHLADLLRFPRASVDTALLPVLLVSSGKHRVALVVDMIEGSREVVMKSVGPQLSTIRWVSGATILGDGRVVIILDMLTLLRSNLETPVKIAPHPETLKAIDKPLSKTIMVVDDSITVRKVTANLLKRQGWEVVTAKDGVDAVAQLQEVVPDLMLLDVEMPRMDGFELATQIRNTDHLRHIPIIMITSRTGTKHRERASKIGIDRHLGKPFNEQELLENINALLSA